MADEEMVSSVSFPDGNKPAIHELYNDDREEAVPAEYRVSDIPLKGHTGLCAGREPELDRLRNYFDQMWVG